MSQPTKEQLNTARIMADYSARGGELSIEQCRDIVEYLSEEEFFEQTAEWKNAVLYHLTGALAVCKYRDIHATEFRMRLMAGHYRAITECTVVRYSENGNGTTCDYEDCTYSPDEQFEIPRTVNGFRYGLEPNGVEWDPETSTVEYLSK